MPWAVALLFGQSAAGAWSSGRPPECGGALERSASVWERAKSPDLGRYCDLLANASSKLAGTAPIAREALDEAREADAMIPGQAAPRALEGRALAALGRLDEAVADLREAKARDAWVFDDPQVLLAWARVLARTGRTDDSESAYRDLLPRASALSIDDRFSATTEAALVALARGPADLDEAVADFRESLGASPVEGTAVAVLGLALALDRRGEAAEARALLSNRGQGDPRAVLSTGRAEELLAVAPKEARALVALGLEASDPAAARDAWQSYVASAPAGPWAAQGRRHLDALTRRSAAERGPR